MLQKLGDHIATCLAQAAAAERRAGEAPTEALRIDLERIAKTWRHLANSYHFVQSLECFLLDEDEARRTQPSHPSNGGDALPLSSITFNPESIAVLAAAYIKAIEGRPASAHENIARWIIEFATTGERDQDRLCHVALALSVP
jgi:hypothetical protein